MSVYANIQEISVNAVFFDDHIEANISTTQIVATIANSITFSSGGGDVTYLHTQAVPSTTWVVNHGMNKYPAISVLLSGEVVGASIVHNSLTQAIITLNSPATGLASCN